MSLRSAHDPGSPREPIRFATTLRFTPQAACGPIEPVFPALLRSLVFAAALALPFVVALFVA
ncbi:MULTISPECIES: hypothetical protein [unclassified Bradyrhizobium]|uniref:hypothetical protein n=1 Tax=unclassified Bradyrhizobium TaxID=2631580 RepID=UPI001BA4BEF0|nr:MULTISPECIES: hypothetical protein [unclassified Bradyrhizobium]MBR1206514.1 hypothetical protein [Bradyrhizobium sp. AUGA SZCCT0124]MBR1315508.1 hypothetical protein [Bradyrhizobium sp. AUGA SZCCT0051]MBR1338430.1 hypothetical protein [Bradyrhizobium sp. AUGA SZCCT0105]MBR1356085.1 hypothetical protein [Bradyrhizobium sp. AUGA SZCCT0045]